MAYDRTDRIAEMKRCALQWADNRWPDEVRIEFYEWPGQQPYMNIEDAKEVLTEEQKFEFYEYLEQTFPDIISF